MSGLTANAKRAHAILETLGFWSSSWGRNELCAVTGRCWYQELVQADGTTESVSNQWDLGISSHPHLNLYQDTAKRHFGPRADHSWCLPWKHFQGWGVLQPILAECQLHILDLHDTFFVIYAGSRGWAGLLGTGCKGTQGHTMCVRSGPVQHRGALALSCNDTQLWERDDERWSVLAL